LPEQGRHAPASPRRTPLLIAGVVALVVVLGIGAAVLAGGGDGIIPGVGDDAPPAPTFAFKVSKPTVETTAQIDPEATVNEARAKAAAAPAADQVATQLHDLYVAAFLEPANWTEANYESVNGFFVKPAQPSVTKQAKVLTAGDGVTDLDSIVPLESTLRLEVLLDPTGKPASVAGIVNFQAKGTGGGSVYIFKSKGQYLFRKLDGEWKVVSFSVRRADTEKVPASSPATPTAEAS
jgi:hypothetical protein